MEFDEWIEKAKLSKTWQYNVKRAKEALGRDLTDAELLRIIKEAA